MKAHQIQVVNSNNYPNNPSGHSPPSSSKDMIVYEIYRQLTINDLSVKVMDSIMRFSISAANNYNEEKKIY